MHHTYTNIVGKDRDVGYGILRMDEDQKWHPYYLGNPVYAFLLMVFFEWGVACTTSRSRRSSPASEPGGDQEGRLADPAQDAQPGAQGLRPVPALTGPFFLSTLAGNAIANLVRNIWTFNIIFCGHFPAGVATFSIEETENESRGQWYYRQLLGSANITGSKLLHVMSGNLSHQIEHHLFPDLPARRYPEISEEVREICERYDLPTTPARCGSSSAASRPRSSASPCRTVGLRTTPGRRSPNPWRPDMATETPVPVAEQLVGSAPSRRPRTVSCAGSRTSAASSPYRRTGR